MTSHPDDDIPPPPYTETDIFSVSNRNNPHSPQSPAGGLPPFARRPSHSHDNASIASNTTNGDPIYTPPLTPRSSHHSTFAGDADHVSLSSSAAAAYFETRPAPPLQGQPHLVHSISLGAGTSPSEIAYPTSLAARDVKLEDWQTFRNYLLPHHTTQRNEQIIDRKLAAEDSRQSTHSNASVEPGARDVPQSPSSGRSHAEAQLGQIRGPDTDATGWRQRAESTVAEWNEGFFGPRGITIRASYSGSSGEDLRLPGSWDQSFDYDAADGHGGGQEQNAEGNGDRSGFNQFFANGLRGLNSRGFNLAGLKIDGDRVSIGNQFVADRNGVRIGQMVANEQGIFHGRNPMFGGPGAGTSAPLWGWRQGGLSAGGCHPCGVRRGGPGRWPHDGGKDNDDDDDKDEHGHKGRAAGRRRSWGERGGPFGSHRGRSRHSDEHHRRERSSSTSSSSSESSVGSLPDYDDLPDTQLPSVKVSLQAFLAQPDTITKSNVKALKQQIKEARKAPENQAKTGINEKVNINYDRNALRKEIRGLMKEWKGLKKQQKGLKKQLRAERRKARKELRKEKRNVKKEMKQAYRDHERRARRGEKGDGPGGPFPGGPYKFEDGSGVTQAPPHAGPPIPGAFPHGPPPPGAAPGVPPVPGIPGSNFNPLGPNFNPLGPNFNPFNSVVSHPWENRGWGRRGGRGRGRGGPRWGHGPFGRGGPFDGLASNRTAPGAWPDDHEPAPDADLHRVSAAKYEALDKIEATVLAKEVELGELHKTLTLEQELQQGAHGSGSGEPKGAKSSRGPSKVAVEVTAVEKELDTLRQKMEQLRVEADAEFARELAEEENYGRR